MQLYRLVQWLALAGLKFLVHLKLNLEFLKIKKVKKALSIILPKQIDGNRVIAYIDPPKDTTR